MLKVILLEWLEAWFHIEINIVSYTYVPFPLQNYRTLSIRCELNSNLDRVLESSQIKSWHSTAKSTVSVAL